MKRRPKQDEPILKDHSEEETMPPNDDDLAQGIVIVETGAGMVTPSQEAALPVGARVIDKTPPEDGFIDEGEEDPRKA